MIPEIELQRKSELADAELGVAEELGWAIACLAGGAAFLKWETWLVAFAIAGGAYLLSVWRYRRRAADAQDKYFRAAGLGKHASNDT